MTKSGVYQINGKNPMRFLLGTILFVAFAGCHMPKLPTEKFAQYTYDKSYYLEGGQLYISLENPLDCPLRVWAFNPDKRLQALFNEINPVLLRSKSDTLLAIPGIEKLEGEITFASLLGNPAGEVRPTPLALPFPKNRAYRIIQGNNGSFTHNTNFSRYALDFNLKARDTVCAATEGFVVGVIDKYAYGGKDKKWKPFGNFITLYDPASGLFTQYVHLVKNGSLVKVGDSVKKGQPIGLSGKTGQTTVEHLHFNCLVPVNTNDGLQSIPYQFEGGYRSGELKKNDLVKN